MKLRKRDRNPPEKIPKEVEELYRVFARYPFRPDMPRCEHCMTDEDIELLGSIPLLEINEPELQNFAWHAMTTVGKAEDLKHFLPAIFHRMLYTGETIDPEILVGKLNYAEWLRWPDDEQMAIRNFFSAWWRDLLSVYPSNHTCLECLNSIAIVTEDITPFLDYWRKCLDLNAIRHLTNLLDYSYSHLIAVSPFFEIWTPKGNQSDQLTKWILHPDTKAKLEDAFIRFADSPYAKEISDAVQQIEWVIDARNKKRIE